MALVDCKECGKQISDKAATCPNCGAPVSGTPQSAQTVIVTVPKSKSTAVLLAVLLGGLGFHKFYLNSAGWGVIYLIFCWTFIPAVVGFFEGISYLSMSEQAFQEKYAYKGNIQSGWHPK